MYIRSPKIQRRFPWGLVFMKRSDMYRRAQETPTENKSSREDLVHLDSSYDTASDWILVRRLFSGQNMVSQPRPSTSLVQHL